MLSNFFQTLVLSVVISSNTSPVKTPEVFNKSNYIEAPKQHLIKRFDYSKFHGEINILKRVNYGSREATRIASKIIGEESKIIIPNMWEEIALKDSDYILINVQEKRVFNIGEHAKELIPALLISNTREIILISQTSLNKLNQDTEYTENIELNNNSAITVKLPENRKEFGIIEGLNGKLSIPVLGLAALDDKDQLNTRLRPNSSTPQGIYKINGLLSNPMKILGGQPYINIDNSSPMALATLTQKGIIDEDYTNQYWANEFIIANAMGRYALRIHGNSVDPENPDNYTEPKTNTSIRATKGCINAADKIADIIETLAQEGYVKEGFEQASSYQSSPALKELYLIVKDF